MSFWSSTTAAPTIWDVMSIAHIPKYIRTKPADYPAVPDGFTLPVRFFRADAATVAEFWKQNYGGDDWYLDSDADFVMRYLTRNNVYIFGIYATDKCKLVGTIVSTPITEGSVIMSHGAALANMRVIEGLCIHREYRGSGIAGYLIGYMDAFTSRLNTVPVVHIWGRELSKSSVISTALRTDTYAYKVCTRKPSNGLLKSMPWGDFNKAWISSSTLWLEETPRIIATRPYIIQAGLDIWIYPVDVVSQYKPIIVVSNTHRKTRTTHQPIYEVVWCGYIHHNILYPAKRSVQYKHMLNDISNRYEGLLFASSAVYNGGATEEWGAEWNYGKSGVHVWNIYNYIPPSFGNCELLTIRNEL